MSTVTVHVKIAVVARLSTNGLLDNHKRSREKKILRGLQCGFRRIQPDKMFLASYAIFELSEGTGWYVRFEAY